MNDLDKSPGQIAGMFDAIAGKYDLLNHVLSAGIDRRWRRLAIRSLELKGSECLLDLCTGTADLAIAARRARPAAARVIGVDFSGAMLRVGREKLAASRLSDQVTLVRGDATRVPLLDGSVDAVTIAFGIRNIESVSAGCSEIYRVLSRGGRFALLEFAVPTTPGVRGLYLWYFNHVLPRIGRIVSRHDAAYDYLPASVGAFRSPDEVVALLRQSGFTAVTASPLTLGIVYLYTGRRE